MTPLDPSDYHAMASFRHSLRKFLRFSKELLAGKSKLSPEQYEALLALRAFGAEEGMSVGVLSENLQVRHHTAVALTNKLLQRKLVTKKRGQKDRRSVLVKLTPAGEELLDGVASVHRNALKNYSREMIDCLAHLKNAPN